MLTYTKVQDVCTIICRCVQRRTPDHGHICLQEKPTELILKCFARPFEKRARNKKNKKMAIAKYSALHASAIIKGYEKYLQICLH